MIKQKFLILLVMFFFALCYIPYTQSEIISEGNPVYTFTMESNSSRIEWIRAYGNLYDDQIFYIFETSDGGFFFISEVGLPPTERYGFTFDNFALAFVKLDSQGEIEWQGVMDLDPRDYYGFTILDKIELTRENVIKFAKYDYVSITGRRHMFGEALSYILKILDKKGYLIGKYNIRFVWGRTSYTKQWNYFQKLLKKIKK